MFIIYQVVKYKEEEVEMKDSKHTIYAYSMRSVSETVLYISYPITSIP